VLLCTEKQCDGERKGRCGSATGIGPRGGDAAGGGAGGGVAGGGPGVASSQEEGQGRHGRSAEAQGAAQRRVRGRG
jgi:hypothetical protein